MCQALCQVLRVGMTASWSLPSKTFREMGDLKQVTATVQGKCSDGEMYRDLRRGWGMAGFPSCWSSGRRVLLPHRHSVFCVFPFKILY